MKAIHKYTLAPDPGVTGLQVRAKAKIIHVAAQGDKIALWYEVDTHEAWMNLDFIIYLTGQEFDKDFVNRQRHVATVLFNQGIYVVHLYEIKPTNP
jgi:hypothetical protein